MITRDGEIEALSLKGGVWAHTFSAGNMITLATIPECDQLMSIHFSEKVNRHWDPSPLS